MILFGTLYHSGDFFHFRQSQVCAALTVDHGPFKSSSHVYECRRSGDQLPSPQMGFPLPCWVSSPNTSTTLTFRWSLRIHQYHDHDHHEWLLKNHRTHRISSYISYNNDDDFSGLIHGHWISLASITAESGCSAFTWPSSSTHISGLVLHVGMLARSCTDTDMTTLLCGS